MALAVQANLVQLKVADAKRRRLAPDSHEIEVPAPGHVKRYRETLIDPVTIQRYTDIELRLRLHEIWGRFCLTCWLFSIKEPCESSTLANLPIDTHMHCGPVLEVKEAELHGLLWRIQFESRMRSDPEFRSAHGFDRRADLAAQIPVRAFDKPIAECSDEDVLLAGCQHAGMLATTRWVADRTRNWNDPDLMTVNDLPF